MKSKKKVKQIKQEQFPATRKAVMIDNRIYYVEGDQLREVLGYGEHLEVHYKIWVAQMELYAPCTNNINSGEIVQGKIYTITGKSISFV
jgi:hypothetical protein